ncbi:MAG: FKBP-type peptidyl-prolyl cis-trans isomerase [Burkholderiales bacterium]|nr:FKBP-type peptidyl-prolyl cis-trans isomerase [Burkholderiales bacterium]
MQASPIVGPHSHLTLRYRVALPDGTETVSTFGARPATLSLGCGQIAEPLERCLVGMREGERRSFTLEPEAAFGPRNPALVRRVALDSLPRALDEAIGERVAFTDARGARFAGVLLEKGERDALFDFNHPLAGRTIVFEAEVIGVM